MIAFLRRIMLLIFRRRVTPAPVAAAPEAIGLGGTPPVAPAPLPAPAASVPQALAPQPTDAVAVALVGLPLVDYWRPPVRRPWRKVGKWRKFAKPPKRPKTAVEGEAEPAPKNTVPRDAVARESETILPWNDPEKTGVIDLEASGIDELKGHFYFRDTILDQLGTYFLYARRMKYTDRQSYDLFHQIGAHILPYGIRLLHKFEHEVPFEPLTELTPWWRFNRNRPSFGAVVYGADPLGERYERQPHDGKGSLWVPKFMYFRKYQRPPEEIQPVHEGDVYVQTIYWDKPYDEKWRKHHKGGVPQEYGLAIDATGNVRALLHRTCETVRLRHKNGQYRSSSFQRHTWDFDESIKDWAKQNKVDPAAMVVDLFIDMASRYEHANNAMITIRVVKGGIAVAFAIDILRLPYFFQDRDQQEGAPRKRIFHSVRAHTRETKKGPVIVPMRFRGETHFAWNGYEIEIIVPGRGNLPLVEFDVGAVDIPDDMPITKEMLTMEKTGKFIVDHLIHGLPRPSSAHSRDNP
jgi:hypothetical protein